MYQTTNAVLDIAQSDVPCSFVAHSKVHQTPTDMAKIQKNVTPQIKYDGFFTKKSIHNDFTGNHLSYTEIDKANSYNICTLFEYYPKNTEDKS